MSDAELRAVAEAAAQALAARGLEPAPPPLAPRPAAAAEGQVAVKQEGARAGPWRQQQGEAADLTPPTGAEDEVIVID